MENYFKSYKELLINVLIILVIVLQGCHKAWNPGKAWNILI